MPNNFKTAVALREQRLGGFDSHALPQYYIDEIPNVSFSNHSRTHLGPSQVAVMSCLSRLPLRVDMVSLTLPTPSYAYAQIFAP